MSAPTDPTPEPSPAPETVRLDSETLQPGPAARFQTDATSFGQILGDFEILGKLGQGGMGTVYRARQISLGRPVALKILPTQFAADAEFVNRFQREARLAARLSHPNLVSVYSSGRADGCDYIAMELIEGETLADTIKRGPLPPADALRIVLDVARALECGWDRGQLIHRDIKPANIFLSATGLVKLGDLGLAKSLESDTTALTQTGTAMGTPHYISPEQARGDKTLDFRSDIYSLGCTLYQMLTGRTPYEGRDPVVVLHQHLNAPPPAILKAMPACPIPLARLLGKMLKKPWRERHASYGELIAALENAQAFLEYTPGASVPAVPADPTPTPPPVTPPPAPPRKSTLPFRAAAGVIALAAVLWFAFGKKEIQLSEAERAEKQRAAHPTAVPQASTPSASTVNLLARVDPAKDALVGPWSLKNGELFCDRLQADSGEVFGNAWCALPYTPPEEYDLIADFTSREGAMVAFVLPSPAAATAVGCWFHWVMGDGVRHSFEQLDGVPCYDLRRKFEASAQTDITDFKGLHHAIIAVRRGSLKAVLDGKTVLEWSGDLKRFRLDPRQPALQSLAGIAVGRSNSPTTFHRLEVREVSGPGKFLRNPAATPAAALPTTGWQPVITDWAKVKAQKGVTVLPDDWVRLDHTYLYGPGRRDVALRVRLRFGGSEAWVLKLRERNPPGEFYSASVQADGASLSLRRQISDKDSKVLAKVPLPRKLAMGQEYDLALAALGSELTVYFDGQPLIHERDTTCQNGTSVIGAGNITELKDPQWLPLPASAPATPIGATPATAGGWIPLLPLIDPQRDTVAGEWKIVNGELLGSGPGAARLELPYAPPDEYDFRVRFTRTAGSGDVALHLVRAGHEVMWLMGAYTNSVWGFHQIGGANAPAHPTALKAGLENGRSYETICKVRRDGVQVVVDGKQVTAYPTNWSDLGTGPPWTFRDPKKLGVACMQPTTFHSIDILPLPSAAPAAGGAGAAGGTAVELLPLVELPRDVIAGEWTKTADGLALASAGVLTGGGPRVELPFQPPEEYDLELDFSVRGEGRDVFAVLGSGPRSFVWRMGKPEKEGTFFGFDQLDGLPVNERAEAVVSRPAPLAVGRYTSTIRVRRGQLHGVLTGVAPVSWSGDLRRFQMHNLEKLRTPGRLGLGAWNRNITFHRVTLRPVGGASPAPALPAAPGGTPALPSATKDAPFVNGLGMKFVPVPIVGGPTGGQRVLFSVWETRVQDYAVFAIETKREWPKPDFEQGPTHPAVNVSWDDAQAFCAWLTQVEHDAGKLGANEIYRLPTDHEWSCAVGIGEREDAAKTPEDKNGKLEKVYPWGTQWPPRGDVGNFGGEELQPEVEAKRYDWLKSFIPGYRDAWTRTAPVGSFAPDGPGLYDLDGNVREWCEDAIKTTGTERVLRGGCWDRSDEYTFRSSYRFSGPPWSRDRNRGFRCVLSVR